MKVRRRFSSSLSPPWYSAAHEARHLHQKRVLTVIALVLSVIAWNQYTHPATTAQAQGPFAGIQLQFDNANFTAPDTLLKMG